MQELRQAADAEDPSRAATALTQVGDGFRAR
jgi:hypothetical protein